MTQQVFINLPVSDLPRAIRFYQALGYSLNPKFTDERAACVVISDTIYVMLLVRDFFQGFTRKSVADAHTQLQTLIALSADSRDEVDAVMDKALAAGGSEAGEPRDYGFMFQRSYADLDGHTWEVFFMDESAFPGA